MKAKFLSILAGSLLLVALFGVNVAPVSAACTNGYVKLYEDANKGGDSITLCVGVNGGLTNLDLITHTQAGLCNAPVKTQDDWNNCTSSAYVALGASRCVFWYDATNGTNLIGITKYTQNGDIVPTFDPNDALGSLRWGTVINGGCTT